MAAKLNKLVLVLLTVGSIGIAAPAQADEPPCIGSTDVVAVCINPGRCYALGKYCF